MTCIIAYSNGNQSFLAGDKLGSDGYTKGVNLEPKIYEKTFMKVSDDGLTKTKSVLAIGGTTSFRMLQLLDHSLVLPEMKSDVTFLKYLVTQVIPAIRELFKDSWGAIDTKQSIAGGQFLVLHEHEIYEVQGDFSVLRSERNFAAVGSGTNHAMAAMAAFEISDDVYERISEIFKITSDMTTGVSAVYDVISY